MDIDGLLRDRFGFSSFLPGQREVIAALAQHGRALAVFPTGGGKSICYQLPSLAFEGLTLVVSPLIALMKDQIDFLTRRGIAAARLDSSLDADALASVGRSIQRGELSLLYVAPERFQNERFLEMLARTKVALFAVDEAHCISEWGHNFRPEYLKLAEAAKAAGAERILALTATATPGVAKDVCRAFDIPEGCAIVTGFYRSNLDLSIERTGATQRDALLLERLRSRPPGSTIVYVTLQKTAERVAEALAAGGLPAEAYHAGLAPEVRAAVQDRWTRSPCGIVVATIAFGMGIDKADVRYVYHYNLPKSLEGYAQEIGRAGRDGARSIVEVLACDDDVATLENFAYGDTPTERAIAALVEDVLGRGEAFAVSLTELSDAHDIRPLVLRTVLTYLELSGVLRQATPFYAGYKLRARLEGDDLPGRFGGEPGEFLRGVFAHAKRGRIWWSIDPDAVAAAMGAPRARVVRALEVLEERGFAELQASDLRHRFVRQPSERAPGEIVGDLTARFARREAHELERIADVIGLVDATGCQANILSAHFGELRAEPCGHCSGCAEGAARPPRGAPTARPLPRDHERAAVAKLAAEHPRALGEARQIARFLCGTTSPALSRARLTRHPLFGSLAEHRFHDVLRLANDMAAEIAPR